MRSIQSRTGLSALVVLTVGLLSGCVAEPGPAVIQLTPINPYYFDELTVEFVQDAVAGGTPLKDHAKEYEYTWYRDNVKQGHHAGPTIPVPEGQDDIKDSEGWAINGGEVWRVEVTPMFNERPGPVSSAEVVVNHTPTATFTVESYDPADPDKSGEDFAGNSAKSIKLRIDTSDADNPVGDGTDSGTADTDDTDADAESEEQRDPTPEHEVLWEQCDENMQNCDEIYPPNPEDVSHSTFAKTENYKVTVTPYTPLPGGYAHSKAYGIAISEPLHFENQPPEFVTNTDFPPGKLVAISTRGANGDGDGDGYTFAGNDPIFCDFEVIDPEEDLPVFSVTWKDELGTIIHGPVDNETQYAGVPLMDGDQVQCAVTPADTPSEDAKQGATEDSALITVGNAVPEVTTIAIVAAPGSDKDLDGNSTTATTGDTVRCKAEFSDYDGDEDFSQSAYTWSDTNGLISGENNVEHVVTAAVGEWIHCTVTPRDSGANTGEPFDSPDFQITEVTNAEPQIDNFSILPDPISEGDTLTCDYDYFDEDGDEDASTVAWFVNGTEVTEVPWVKVELHYDVACALDQQGVVTCWGNAEESSLIDDPPDDRFTELAVGGHHACGLTAVGAIICWGPDDFSDDDEGQVRNAPTGLGYRAIGSGWTHSCAINSAAEIECWGDNTFGQLSGIPEGNFEKLWVGEDSTCVMDTDNEVVCFGSDLYLEKLNNELPEDMSDYVELSHRFEMCGLDGDGSITCWKSDSWLDGPELHNEVPTGSGYTSLTVGEAAACVINDATEIVCWGHNDSGNVKQAPTDSGYLDVDMGYDSACAVKTTGEIVCWGSKGQVSFSPKVVSDYPAVLSTPTDTLTGLFDLGDEVECLLTPSDGVNTLAPRSSGTLVVENTSPKASNVGILPGEPNTLDDLTCDYVFEDDDGDVDQSPISWSINGASVDGYEWVDIAAASTHMCAIDELGAAYCWGDGELFDEWDGTGYSAVAVGWRATCLLDDAGAIECAGKVDELNNNVPVEDGFVHIAVGNEVACALDEARRITCWGPGYYGAPSSVPNEAGQLDLSLFEVDGSACSINSSGQIQCWGDTLHFDNASSGNEIPTSESFRSISTGYDHACALDTDGAIHCFGQDAFGQVSDAPTKDGFVEVFASEDRSCALNDIGEVTCWGDDSGGAATDAPADAGHRTIAGGSFGSHAIDQDGYIVSWGDWPSDVPTTLSPLGDVLAAEKTEVDDEIICVVVPNDGTVAGMQSSSPVVIVSNQLPAVSNVSTSPDPAPLTATVTCDYDFEDGDGDPDQSLIVWSVNGGVLSENSDGDGDPTSLSAGFVEGGTVKCAVTAYDGMDTGNTETDTTTVNYMPVVSAVSISPSVPLTTDTLTCNYTFSDGDGDADLSSVDWSLEDGTQLGTGVTLDYAFVGNEEVICTVQAYDGTEVGAAVDSDAITVFDTEVPLVNSVEVLNTSNMDLDGNEYTAIASDILLCEFGYEDDDGDPFLSEVEWFNNGVSVDSGSSLDAVFVAGDSISCTVTPYDGWVYGSPVSSADFLIDNAKPTAYNVQIESTTNADGDGNPDTAGVNDNLECIWDFSDIDAGDADNSTVEWFLNGVSAGSSTTLAGSFSNGDSIDCLVTPNDGTAGGVPVAAQDEMVIGAWHFVEAVAGSYFSCALTSEGAVICWGDDLYNQVSGAPTSGTFSGLSAGRDYTCALSTSGDAQCWGEFPYTPPAVTFQNLSAGAYHACGVTPAGDIQCWGGDWAGQVSQTPSTGSYTTMSGGGYHSCSLTAAGDAQCWGDTTYGNLSVPSFTFANVSAGFLHTCGVTTGGALECWGEDGGSGQVTPPTGSFTSVSAGNNHSCAVTSLGAVECWGEDSSGQATPPTGSFTSVSAGNNHSCAVTSLGAVECWGDNSSDQSTTPCVNDADCDGVITVFDCDDGDDAVGDIPNDADCDGVLYADDCNDDDASLGGFLLDTDCDGIRDSVSAQGVNLLYIPSGSFDMGCTAGQSNCDSDESPVQPVTLTSGFWLGETEVTQGEWQDMMGNNPSYFSVAGAGTDCGTDCPVEQVSWWEAVAFSNAVSTAQGLSECYAPSGCTGTAGIDLACDSLSINTTSGSVYDCEGYRLPTEAEWEYAARAGTDLLYSGSDTISDVAWHEGNSSETHPVARLLPNTWGLYDMSGNVWEWSTDWYDSSFYSSGASADPEGGASGTERAYRGGCYWINSDSHRVANRSQNTPAYYLDVLGFRLARSDVYDADGDGVETDLDCDDTDASLGDSSLDADCDGVPTADDCDDNDSLNVLTDDCDQDGVPTADDCDDADVTLHGFFHDLDCDGYAVGSDCDDGDALVGPCDNDSISLGTSHTCALNEIGLVSCWGSVWDPVVTDVPASFGFAHLTSGDSFACALDGDGAITCWGGITGTPSGDGYDAVTAAAHHACALDSLGAVTCWGDDEENRVSGQPSGNGYTSLGLADYLSCALDQDGAIDCWGENYEGQVSGRPTGTGFVSVAGGNNHACALDSVGAVTCWGHDGDGQISNAPTGNGYVAITGGDDYSCALDWAGEVTCWGVDYFFQTSYAPAGTGFVQIMSERNYVGLCALDATGEITCWGYNYQGQLTDTPTGGGFTEVVTGSSHNCARRATTDLTCWGSNSSGQSPPSWSAVDGDDDGVWSAYDCDDGDGSLGKISLDPDCDGVAGYLAQGITFLPIADGGFDMGCTASQAADGNCQADESPSHTVLISRDFYLADTEVTQGQWQALMNNNPSWLNNGTCADCPVEMVTYWDALAFANELSNTELLTNCYDLSACTGTAGVNLDCTSVPIASLSGSPYDCTGYRLPSEAEWERAARAGTDLLYSGSDTLNNVGWYGGSTSHAVRGKSSNAWALYDMSGNVWEWTWDRYASDTYATSPAYDPEGANSGEDRVIRGGSWGSTADISRVAYRNSYDPGEPLNSIGFRLAQSDPFSVDGDSDGVYAAFDCDDADDGLGDIALDPECDGV